MTKDELITAISQNADVSKKHAGAVFEALYQVVTQALHKGDEVALAGLGKFKPRAMPARTGRNPKSGESVQIAAGRKVAFSPSKALKEAMN